MKSNTVFCIMIMMLLTQAGCAPRPTPAPAGYVAYSMSATLDDQPLPSLVGIKAESCYDDSGRYMITFEATADMELEAILHEISLGLNIEIDDISKITLGEPVKVKNNSNIHSTSIANVYFPPLLDPLTTVTGTITITAFSEREISGSASLVFTDTQNVTPAVEDSVAYEVTFNNLPVVHYCGMPTPTDIQFVLDNTYRVGELIQVKIQNVGQVPYFYNRAFTACELSYFDASGRKFLIPPGTHCDLIEYVEIKPGEIATLFEWDLSECIEDQWGCVKSQPLPTGTYTIRGTFHTNTTPEGGSAAIAEATIEIIYK